MAKKLFIGGLPFTTTSDELSSMFAQAGTVVSAIVITDKFSGRSKGFGFVEMETDEEADKAKEMFNNSEELGRKIIVNDARPQENSGRRFGGGHGGRE